MNGGYEQIEVEFEELVASCNRRFPIPPHRAGIAVTVRDRGAIVGFSLHQKSASQTEISHGHVLTPDVHAVAISGRLRERVVPPQSGVPLSLTIAICTRDRPEHLSRLLDSLLRHQARHSFELLVVDNAPNDARTREIVKALQDVRYILEPKPGLDFARNRALRESSGNIIAFLDDDVVVDHNYSESLIRAWRENSDAAAITGLVMPLTLETEAQVKFEQRGGFRRGFHFLRFGPTLAGVSVHPCDAGKFGAGANMSFDVELLRELGGFDDALDTGAPLPGGGDLDMFYRVIRCGRILVYEPKVAVYHEHRRELSQLKRQYYTWGLGFAAFLSKTRRHDPVMKSAINRLARLWFIYQIRAIIRRVLGKGVTPVPMILAEVFGGVRGLLGEYSRSERRTRLIKEGIL